MEKIVVKRYSEAFKKQVVSEYENGESSYQLNRKYGITGTTTVTRWVKKYGRKGLRHQLMTIQTVDEQNQLKQLEEENKQLKEMVHHLTVKNIILESALELAEEEGFEVKKKENPSWAKLKKNKKRSVSKSR